MITKKYYQRDILIAKNLLHEGKYFEAYDKLNEILEDMEKDV